MSQKLFDKQFAEERIRFYNKKVVECYDKASKLEGAEREYQFDEAYKYSQAVASLEKGLVPDKALPTETYFIEKEDDSCAGGACKI